MRTITWYNADGDVVSIQNCAVGLEDVSQPEGATGWIEGSPQQIRNARVVDNEIINGSITETGLDEQVRLIRNSRLTKSDWTQAADSPLSEEKKTEWANYRQQLRDMPNNLGDAISIEDVTFPTPPSN